MKKVLLLSSVIIILGLTGCSKQPDEEWNPLFAEALHKKNYIEYLLDILLYGSLEERKALVAEQRKTNY